MYDKFASLFCGSMYGEYKLKFEMFKIKKFSFSGKDPNAGQVSAGSLCSVGALKILKCNTSVGACISKI